MDKLHTIVYNDDENTITIIDQTKLPDALVYKELKTLQDVYIAIKDLEVRGAPLIGVTAAYGLAMHAQKMDTDDKTALLENLVESKNFLESARPTAVNLENALRCMTENIAEQPDARAIKETLIARAKEFHTQDIAISEAIGRYGNTLLNNGAQVLTYCNAGLLATSNTYGTALAPVYKAVEEGKHIAVTACETRPILQGARLTTFELTYNNVPTTLITDSMMGWLFSTRNIDAIFVGCDRVAKNGDFANKIGTYTLSVLAKEHGIPFYVCTPSTTIDFSAESAVDIPIEMRKPEEVRSLWYEKPMVAERANILNPAFDCTPAANVTAFITEKGILNPPFRKEQFES